VSDAEASAATEATTTAKATTLVDTEVVATTEATTTAEATTVVDAEVVATTEVTTTARVTTTLSQEEERKAERCYKNYVEPKDCDAWIANEDQSGGGHRDEDDRDDRAVQGNYTKGMEYMHKYADGQGNYTKGMEYMHKYGDEANHGGYGDYSKYMNKYGGPGGNVSYGDYSKYMNKYGGGGSSGSYGDYQKYVDKYTGNNSKYEKKYEDYADKYEKKYGDWQKYKEEYANEWTATTTVDAVHATVDPAQVTPAPSPEEAAALPAGRGGLAWLVLGALAGSIPVALLAVRRRAPAESQDATHFLLMA
jgi:hypothetical protein